MLRELLATFNVDTGQAAASLKSLDKKIEGAKNTLGALASAFVGSAFVHGLSEFIQTQIDLGSRVNDLSDKLGVGTDELQQFQFAAQLCGVGAEGAGQALNFFNKNIGLAIEGNQLANDTFARLGVSLKDGSGNVRELGDMIPEIADAFAKMGSQQERVSAAMQIFGKQGAELLPLLKDGSGGLREMYAEFDRLGGGMSKDFVAAADKAGDEIDKLKFAFAGWKTQIAFVVLPALTALATKGGTLVGALRRVTKESRLAEVACIALGIAGAAAGAKAAVGFANFIGIVPKDASFWTKALGLFEIGLVVAGVALLFLAFEDFFTFLEGGDSIIGDLIEKFLGLETANDLIKQLTDTWLIISGLFAEDLDGLEPLVALFKDLGKQVIPYLVAGFVDVVRIVAALVLTFAALVKGFVQLTQFDFDGLAKTFKSAGNGLFGDNGLLTKSAQGDLILRNKHRDENRADATSEVYHVGRGGGDVSVTQKNEVNVTVQGGANARATGDAVKNGTQDALDGELQNAYAAADRGG